MFERAGELVRSAGRRLRRQPGASSVVILTLALGIGATSAVFSAIDALTLRSLPYTRGDRVVLVRQQFLHEGKADIPFSVAELNDYRRSVHLRALADFSNWPFVLRGQANPESLEAGVVSANFFEVLGIRPLLGRLFRPEDSVAGAPGVVVLSHGAWMRRFGADPGIVGRVLQLDDRQREVVGVLPDVPVYPAGVELFAPSSAVPNLAAGTDERRDDRRRRVIARLRDGSTIDQLRHELAVLTADLERTYPQVYPASRGYAASVVPLREELTRAAMPTFWLLVAVVALVLVLACVNVAALVFARIQRRGRELAIHLALGAGHARLAATLFTETLVLSVIGAALGLLLAALGRNALVAFAARLTPMAGEIVIDWRTVVFATALGVGAAAVATGASFRLLAREPGMALQDGGERSTLTRRQRRTSRSLVATQVALAVVLLVCAGVLLRSVVKLAHADPGFEAGRVTTAEIRLPQTAQTTRAAIVDFAETVLTRLNADPAVVSASMAGTYPLNSRPLIHMGFAVDDQPVAAGETQPQADMHFVTPGYFRTLGMRLLSGRDFTPADRLKAERVVIVNRALQHRLWGEGTAVDRMIRVGPNPSRVVGVVDDIHQRLDAAAADEMYIPYFQNPVGSTVLIRTRDDGGRAIPVLREALRQLNPESVVAAVRTLDEARADELRPPRHTMALVIVCGVLALLIAAVGAAGMLALSIAGRLPEISIRLALGAGPRRIRWMLMREGFLPAGLGILVALPAAIGLAHAARNLFFEVDAADPVTLGVVVILVVLSVAAACVIPAARAARVDPLGVLRS